MVYEIMRAPDQWTATRVGYQEMPEGCVCESWYQHAPAFTQDFFVARDGDV